MAMAMNAGLHNTDPYTDPDATSDDRTYAMFTHIVGGLSILDISGMLALIASFVMWQVRKNDSNFIDDHGREAVNFQISMVIIVVGAVVLGIVLTAATFGLFAPIALALGGLGGVFLWVVRLVGTVRGAIAAHKGQWYRYPMSVRVIPDRPTA